VGHVADADALPPDPDPDDDELDDDENATARRPVRIGDDDAAAADGYAAAPI
jgi:hypothetical protein